MATTKTVLESVKTEGTEEIIFGAGGQLTTTPCWNPFIIVHGRSKYEVKSFKFYNEEGIKFETTSGWFGSNNGRGSMMFRKDGKEAIFKKKKTIKYDTNEVYFISQGKDWSGGNKATVYVPMAYLTSMGYERIQYINKGKFETFTREELVTPEFTETLVYKSERHFDKQKEAFMKEMGKATTPAEFKEVIKKWEHKVY